VPSSHYLHIGPATLTRIIPPAHTPALKFHDPQSIAKFFGDQVRIGCVVIDEIGCIGIL